MSAGRRGRRYGSSSGRLLFLPPSHANLFLILLTLQPFATGRNWFGFSGFFCFCYLTQTHLKLWKHVVHFTALRDGDDDCDGGGDDDELRADGGSGAALLPALDSLCYDPVLSGFQAGPMPNPGTKNAKFEVLFTVSRKFKCQTVNAVDKILMPSSKCSR